MRTREESIAIIEDLYPADSRFKQTKEIGERFLLLALSKHWRSLPTEVLAEYAELSLAREEGILE